jgi:hypothetical protein
VANRPARAMAAMVIGAVVLNRNAPADVQHGCHGDVRSRLARRLRMGDTGFNSFKTTEDKTNRVLRETP